MIFSLILSFLLGCASVRTEPPLSYIPFKTIPMKGRLIKGNYDQLPRGITESIDESSPYLFKYSEIKSFDESYVPDMLSLLVFTPFQLLGMPLGKKKCMVSATFEIIDKEKILRYYNAKSFASNYYGYYYGTQLNKLEEMAFHEVRLCIEEMISNDHEFLKNLKY